MRNEYLDLINELNEAILENKFFENLGMGFSYTTNGWCHSIDFGNFNLYNSENDSLYHFDELSNQDIDISLKEFVTKKLFILADELKNMSLEIANIQKF